MFTYLFSLQNRYYFIVSLSVCIYLRKNNMNNSSASGESTIGA